MVALLKIQEVRHTPTLLYYPTNPSPPTLRYSFYLRKTLKLLAFFSAFMLELLAFILRITLPTSFVKVKCLYKYGDRFWYEICDRGSCPDAFAYLSRGNIAKGLG